MPKVTDQLPPDSLPAQAQFSPETALVSPVKADASSQEIGYASGIKNYLVSVSGLPNVNVGEIVITHKNARGLVMSLKDNLIDVLMLDPSPVKTGEIFIRTGEPFMVNLGPQLLGRVISPTGAPLDGRGRMMELNTKLPTELPPRGMKDRETIREPFETGITTVDMLIPLAKGQRELIIGDARSGKTGFLVDTIINQQGKGVICVYALIGRSNNEIKRLIEILHINQALSYTCVVAASSSEVAPLIYLAPSVAVTIAEYFQRSGRDVLLVLDDLGAHAKYYREISLLSNHTPGRESYPGDIFYQHAHILERAGKFNPANGGGSITALPVIETNLDDFTAFIPTNLMAMTDGHLMFNSALYHQGVRPAIDISLSVSRVGRQAQGLSQKLLADRVRTVLAQAGRLETLSRFGSEVSSQTQLTLKQSEQIKILIKQSAFANVPKLVQMMMLGLIFTPFFSTRPAPFVKDHKDDILSYLSRLNLVPLQSQVGQLKNDQEFISLISSLIPQLEKLCQT